MTKKNSVSEQFVLAYVMIKLLLFIAMTIMVIVGFYPHDARAQQVLPKEGSCPPAYTKSGNYCVPLPSTMRDGREVVQRESGCPPGYGRYGENHCRQHRTSSNSAVRKWGQCPAGWFRYENYCVKR